MNKRFLHYLKIVAIIHIITVAVVLTFSNWQGCRRNRTTMLPVNLMMIEPVAMITAEPVIETLPPEVKPPPPKRKPKRKKPVVNNTFVKRSKTPKKPVKTLTPEEIKKLFTPDAQMANRNVTSDKDALYDAIVQQTFRSAWTQPSFEEAGDARVTVEIRLLENGTVASWKFVAKSGNAVLDSSVEKAVNSVRKINGLSAGYLRRNKRVTLPFKVKNE